LVRIRRPEIAGPTDSTEKPVDASASTGFSVA